MFNSSYTANCFFVPGAHCLKKLISVQQEYHKQYDKTPPEVKTEQQSPRIEAFMERQRTEEISNIYPNADNIPEKLDIGGEAENFLKKKKEPV